MPQIINTFRLGTTGQLAFASFFLNFAGSGARLWTVYVESDDFMFRLQFFIGFFLNTIIMIQFAMYWNAKPAEGKKPKTAPKKVKEQKEKVN